MRLGRYFVIHQNETSNEVRRSFQIVIRSERWVLTYAVLSVLKELRKDLHKERHVSAVKLHRVTLLYRWNCNDTDDENPIDESAKYFLETSSCTVTKRLDMRHLSEDDKA